MPTKPDIANYEKRLKTHTSSTRRSTPGSSVSEAAVPGGKPTNVAEMTTAGREAYKIDLSEYREDKSDYEKEL